MPPLFERVSTLRRRLGADRSGFSAVLTALALTMLMGFVGLAIDVGMWQWTQRDMQEAADHAAFAAAQSDVALNPPFSFFSGSVTQTGVTPNDASTSIQTGLSVAISGLGLNPATFTQTSAPAQAPNNGQCYSSQLAGQQGYTAADNVIQICVIYGLPTGQDNDYAWQVTIAQPRPMWFSKILFSHPSTISVSAVAQPKSEGPQSCVIALNPSTTTLGLQIDGSGGTANVTLSNCDTLVSSNNTANALETTGAANFTARAVYVVGQELNGGLTFTPGPGAAQNYQNLADVTPFPEFFYTTAHPSWGDPYYALYHPNPPNVDPPAYNGAGSGTAPGTPNPNRGRFSNGCDYYTGDYIPPGHTTPDGIHVNLPPQGTTGAALASYDGPGVYCQSICPATTYCAAAVPNTANFVPWAGSMLPQGLYILYGVGMQLPTSTATMTYTCVNTADTYQTTTATCNLGGTPQIDSAWGQCSGGDLGVSAAQGVTIYVMPGPTAPNATSSNTAQVQLTGNNGGSTCFMINAPQSQQIGVQAGPFSCTSVWSAPTYFSNSYAGSVTDCTLAQDIAGAAIWVASSMSNTVSDTIGPNASIAMNGAFYDPSRTVYVGANSSGAPGTTLTTLTGTGSTTNASGPTDCSQIVANNVNVQGPANVNLAFCVYVNGTTSYTYLRNPDYNYLGSVQLVQ